MKKDSQDFKDGLTAGIILSAATLVAIHMEGAAEQLVGESGLKWDELRQVRADPGDRKLLKKIKRAFL